MANKPTYPIDYTQGSTDPKSLKDQAADATQAVKEKMTEAVDKSAEVAKQTAEQLSQLGSQLEETLKGLSPALRQSLKDQPLTTLAAAAAVAFVLGAIWKK